MMGGDGSMRQQHKLINDNETKKKKKEKFMEDKFHC